MTNNKLIYQCRDELGPIEVFEDGITRSLHFGSRSRQSSMLLLNSTVLVLSYTRAVLMSLIFNPQPENVLILGHGGGSIAKFFLKHYPQTNIDVVELRQKVIEVSQRFFEVPKLHPKLTIHHADILNYIQQANSKKYDIIIVDAFTEQGLAESVHADSFFSACNRLLGTSGVLSMNIWTNHKQAYHALLRRLSLAFDNDIYEIPVRERGNSILLTGPAIDTAPSHGQIVAHGEEYRRRFGIEFPIFIEDMIQPVNNKLRYS